MTATHRWPTRAPSAPGFPAHWVAALEGLRPAPLPVSEAPPIQVGATVRALESSVRDPQGWDALVAQARNEPLLDTARRWQRTQERVRQVRLRALRQLQLAARHDLDCAALIAWAQTPRLVTPDDADEWGVLLLAARTLCLDVRTARVSAAQWALYVGAAPYALRSLTLAPGEQLSAEVAARRTGFSADLLRVAWPATNLTQLRSGAFTGPLNEWSSRHWLSALIGALRAAGEDTWDERLLLRAYRAVPGAPDVQDGTLRTQLRGLPQLTRVPGAALWTVKRSQA